MNGVKIISDRMHRAVKDGVFPGAVLLVARGDDVLFHNGFGWTDNSRKKETPMDAIYDVASLTKPLATTMALAVMMASRPDLSKQPVASILNAFNTGDKNEITVDMLMRHTSGLPAHRDYFKKLGEPDGPGNWEKCNTSPRQALRSLIAKEPLQNRPGTVQVYSDIGFMALSWLVEAITAISLDQYVSTNLYRPLGLEDLFFIPVIDRTARLMQYGHRLVPTRDCPWRGRLLVGEVEDENAWAAGGVEGHAGLFSDAFSVYRLCGEILSAWQDKRPRVLCPDVIRQFLTRTTDTERPAGFDIVSTRKSSAGRYFSKNTIGHLGFTGTSFWMDLDTGVMVILLSNRVHPTRENTLIKFFRPEIHNLVHAHLL